MDISITFTQLDIHTTVVAAIFFLIVVGAIILVQGRRIIGYGTQITYYKKRRKIVQRGWYFILLALIIGLLAVAIGKYGEDAIYRVYPPSPTTTLTPTITLTPTSTTVPTLTFTPTLTITPAISSTPSLSEKILSEFSGETTPNYDALFSPLIFAFSVDSGFQPVDPGYEFYSPEQEIFASFSFDQMRPGSQWTAVWINPDREIICYETSAWGEYTGGYGYSKCELSGGEWIAGDYEVQFFLGETWKTSGRFTVIDGNETVEGQTDEQTTTPSP